MADVTTSGASRGAAEADIPAVERLIDLALFGPVNLGACVVERLPTVVERARRELVLARMVGELAVDRGARELRRRIGEPEEGTVEGRRQTGAQPVTGAEPPPGAGDAPPRPEEGSGGGAVTGATDDEPADELDDELDEVPDVGELALPDYDHLPAAHVVGKLGGLSEAERAMIGRYERAHRHRRTVLGKLDQLGAGSS